MVVEMSENEKEPGKQEEERKEENEEGSGQRRICFKVPGGRW